MYPMHIHGERDFYYTVIHVEAPDQHPYTLNDFFTTWVKWSGDSRAPRFDGSNFHFLGEDLKMYRSATPEVWLRYGPTIDPAFENYSRSERTYALGDYAPVDGDVVEVIAREPFYQV